MLKKSILLAIVAGMLVVACDNATSSNPGGGGNALSGTIQAGRDTAVNLTAGQTLKFTFVPKAGATYSITTTGKTDTYLEVRDKFDKTLETDDYPSSLNGSIVLVTKTADPVTILVSGATPSTAGGTIVSVILTNGPDDFEDDDRLGTAKELKPDSVLQARTITAGDTDWVKIPVVAGRRYLVSVPTSSYTTYLQAFDKDSTSLGYATSSSIAVFAPSTGFLFVRIHFSYDNYSGSYSVRAWSDTANLDKYEVDDTRPAAKKVVIDSAAQPHKLAVGEQDWVKFDVVADSTYRITISTASGTSLDYELYSGLTTTLSTRSGSVTSGSTGTITYLATSTGTMYLNLNGYFSDSKGPYTVSVAKIPDPNGPDSYESDNTLSSAKPIVIGAAAQSRTIRSADVDWIKVPVDSGRSYNVASGTSTYTLYLQVFDADSVSIATSTSSSTTFRAPYTGFVYVRAYYASTSYTGSYTVSARALANVVDSYEPDDTKLTAKTLPTDGTIQSRHLVAGEHDWMKMELVAGKTYTFTTTNPSTSWSFQGEIQSETSTSTLGSVSGSSTLNTSYFEPATSGTYYLDFHGYSSSSNGEYTIRVVAN